MSRNRAPIATLYVRNISDRARYDDLRRLFQKYGKIVDITIPLDYYSRSTKGYAFVQFEDQRDAEEALYKLDKQPLFGRELEVEYARGDRKSATEIRNRDRDRKYNRGDNGRGGSGRGGSGREHGYGRNDSRRSRSRSHSHHRSSKSDRHSKRSRGRDSRSKSRSSRSVSKDRSPHKKSISKDRSSPDVKNNNNKSMSRERSRSGSPPVIERNNKRSNSRNGSHHSSPPPIRRHKNGNASRSRSGSPMDD